MEDRPGETHVGQSGPTADEPDLGPASLDRAMGMAFGGGRRSDAETVSPPVSCDRYTVLDEISRDPTSVMLRGRDHELDREVALKVLEDDGRGVKRFLEEAQLGAQLQHPGILPVLGLGFLEDAGRSSRSVE